VLVDFVMDTTRAVAGLLYGGTLQRCPQLRLVVAHGGGAIPYLASRLELAGSWQMPDGIRGAARDSPRSLQRLYFETAQSFAPGTLACLSTVTDDSHILFGTDYPMLSGAAIQPAMEAVSTYPQLSTAKVARENALALFPSLRTEAEWTHAL
jgi:predicted TIM-barrel fold metal-dependent hydrolase